MRKISIIMVFAMFLAGSYALSVLVDEGPHFHCPVCGSPDYGSLWHDSDKDGEPDR